MRMTNQLAKVAQQELTTVKLAKLLQLLVKHVQLGHILIKAIKLRVKMIAVLDRTLLSAKICAWLVK